MASTSGVKTLLLEFTYKLLYILEDWLLESVELVEKLFNLHPSFVSVKFVAQEAQTDWFCVEHAAQFGTVLHSRHLLLTSTNPSPHVTRHVEF